MLSKIFQEIANSIHPYLTAGVSLSLFHELLELYALIACRLIFSPYLFLAVFTVSGGGESRSRVFTAKTNKHDFNLTLDNGTVTGRKVWCNKQSLFLYLFVCSLRRRLLILVTFCIEIF